MKNEYNPKLSAWLESPSLREKLRASEKRIKSSFDELFSGYSLKAEDVLNDVIRTKDYTGVVDVRRISFYTFCEHHFAPFFGTADVIYQPNKVITGLGKIVRLVKEVHARRLQIQEIMTKDIALDMQRVLDAKGVFVITRAKHLCMCSRGPSDDNAETVVTFGCGSLEKYTPLTV